MDLPIPLDLSFRYWERPDAVYNALGNCAIPTGFELISNVVSERIQIAAIIFDSQNNSTILISITNQT